MRRTRTRLVNFRVTDEEFERLKTASERRGARCLSDFARAIILHQPEDPSLSGSYDDKFQSFDRRLNSLERSMSRLVAALSGTDGQNASGDN